MEIFEGGGSPEEESLLDSWAEPDAPGDGQEGDDADLGFMNYNDPNGFLLP